MPACPEPCHFAVLTCGSENVLIPACQHQPARKRGPQTSVEERGCGVSGVGLGVWLRGMTLGAGVECDAVAS